MGTELNNISEAGEVGVVGEAGGDDEVCTAKRGRHSVS